MNARIAPLVLGSVVLAFGCGDKGESDSGSDSDSGGAGTGDCATVHEVTTTDDTADMDLYMDFTPEDLTIAAGDCVRFIMSDTHNAVEVSAEDYESRSGTPLAGGFEVTFGETAVVAFNEVGTHYYVCQPHIQMDMVGTITVQ